MKILVVAPHPDDEVLGCGGTIAKYSEGTDEVYLCIVTKAYTPEWSEEFLNTRKNEIKESNQIIGIKKTYFLDFPTVKLDKISQKDLNDALSKVMEDVKPEILYIPHKGDLNLDHRLIFESSLVASRPVHSSVRKVMSYEILSETEWGSPINNFNPNIYEDISPTFNKKAEAMSAYRSEIREHPHPRSIKAMEILAQKRGFEVGLDYCESFMLIREIIK